MAACRQAPLTSLAWSRSRRLRPYHQNLAQREEGYHHRTVADPLCFRLACKAFNRASRARCFTALVTERSFTDR
jgi:hypothetical protein